MLKRGGRVPEDFRRICKNGCLAGNNLYAVDVNEASETCGADFRWREKKFLLTARSSWVYGEELTAVTSAHGLVVARSDGDCSRTGRNAGAKLHVNHQGTRQIVENVIRCRSAEPNQSEILHIAEIKSGVSCRSRFDTANYNPSDFFYFAG